MINFENKIISISVVIPAYNEEKTISKLIEALLEQTYMPDEIIINYKKSKDKTKEIISKYCENNKNIILINRVGICRGSARNEAANLSKSQYIAFIDAGIIPDKNWLMNFINNIKKNKSEIVFGSVYFSPNNFLEESYAVTFFDKSKGLDYICPSVASMLIKRDVWNKIELFPISKDGSYVVEDLRFINSIIKSKIFISYDSKAKVNWLIDLNIKKLFFRFLNNSYGGLKTGFFKSWHLGLIRNIAIFLFIFLISFLVSKKFIFLIIFLILYKSFNYLKISLWFKKSNFLKKILYLIITSLFFILIDIASLIGLIKWVFSGMPRVNKSI